MEFYREPQQLVVRKAPDRSGLSLSTGPRKFYRWPQCKEVVLPNTYWTTASGQTMLLEKFFCFDEGVDQDPAAGSKGSRPDVRVPPSAFLNLARAADDQKLLKKFARRYGPLGVIPYFFQFESVSYEQFIDKWIGRISELGEASPDIAQGLEDELRSVARYRYVRDWKAGKLKTMCCESLEDWSMAAREFRELHEAWRALRSGDFDILRQRFPVDVSDYQQVDSGIFRDCELSPYNLQRYGPEIRSSPFTESPLSVFWLPFVTDLKDGSSSDYAFSPEGEYDLYETFLFGICDRKLRTTVSVSFHPKFGLELDVATLYGRLWLDAVEFMLEKPEYICCKACGKWTLVTGKARGRGKQTCNKTCRSRLSQMRREAAKSRAAG